jgi:adenylylsulfate kinase
VRTLFLNGTVGAGKTTVAGAVGAILQERGIPHAIIDLDALRDAWPAPADDPFNSALELRNLAAVVANYRQVGVTHLVLAGVIETLDGRAGYERVLGGQMTVCRLDVDLAVVRQRLAGRHALESSSLAWHLDRSGELQGILVSAAVEDAVVDVTALSVTEAAAAVLRATSWPRPV